MATFKDRVFELLYDSGDSEKEFLDKVNAVGGLKLQRNFFTRMTEPSMKTCLAICKVYDCTPEWLVGLSDIRKSANDNVNLAAQTTGLSVDTIKELSAIRDYVLKEQNKLEEWEKALTPQARKKLEKREKDNGRIVDDFFFDSPKVHILSTIERIIHDEYIRISDKHSEKERIDETGSILHSLASFYQDLDCWEEYGDSIDITRDKLQTVTPRRDKVKLAALYVFETLSRRVDYFLKRNGKTRDQLLEELETEASNE